jgi:integrase
MYDGVFTKKNLLSFKGFLIEKYSPKTVNLRILAINKYLEFNKMEKLKLKMIKVQQKTYLENVISDADYKFFKNKLKKDGRMNWYFIVRYLAATGARISELVQIKIEHVHKGYIDIYGKGGKVRRIYIYTYVIPISFLQRSQRMIRQIFRMTSFLHRARS